MITYHFNKPVVAQDVANLYSAAQLSRPVDDLSRIEQMYAGSNLVWSAWDNNQLIGVLRGWSDGAFNGFICDLAVHPDYQKQGLGKELLERARTMNDRVQLLLRASLIAENYYAHLGWQKIDNGWFYPRAI